MLHHHHHGPIITRRSALMGVGASLSLGYSKFARAASAGAPRLVVLNIMGGLDGLSSVAPYGDPNLVRLRAPLMAPQPGKAGGMLDLGGYFGMHPALTNLHAMYMAGEALVVHAVGNASSDRSHFQGQDYLQSGEPLLLSSGWLNRVANLVPAAQGSLQSLVNMGLQTPLLAEGPAPVAGWNVASFPKLSATAATQILAMAAADPLLGPAAKISFADSASMASIIKAAPGMPAGLPGPAQLAWMAGDLLGAADGPQIATLVLDGVDTHFDQVNRLNTQLYSLDLVFAALKAALGTAWTSTVVLTMTEFGRTAAVNGTGGTDHGTGFAVFLAGGAIAGGRVMGTWPGLASSQLYEGRDLQPLIDFRQVAASVLSSHLNVSAGGLAQVFPAGYGSLLSGLTRS